VESVDRLADSANRVFLATLLEYYIAVATDDVRDFVRFGMTGAEPFKVLIEGLRESLRRLLAKKMKDHARRIYRVRKQLKLSEAYFDAVEKLAASAIPVP